jgi:hypothetical protein
MSGFRDIPDAVGAGGGGAADGVGTPSAWNASTNSPSLSDGSGSAGDLYIVTVAGSTSLDGITDWAVGDLVFFDATAGVWRQIDNESAGVTVNTLGSATPSAADGDVFLFEDQSDSWAQKKATALQVANIPFETISDPGDAGTVTPGTAKRLSVCAVSLSGASESRAVAAAASTAALLFFTATGSGDTDITYTGEGSPQNLTPGDSLLLMSNGTDWDVVRSSELFTKLDGLSNPSSASTTVEGIVELATSAETQTGSDTTRAVTPAGLASLTATDSRAGLVELATQAEVDAGSDATRAVTPSTLQNKTATTTTKGVVELATVAEVDTGSDILRAITPDALAGSVHGEKVIQVVAFDYATDCATGDGAAYFTLPTSMDGFNLVDVHARCITAGTTGTMDVQIRNVTDAVDVLSTKITIDTGETGSDTAAPAVINTSNDDVDSWDLWAVDVDAVHSGTAAQGLIVTLVFRLP